MHSKHPLYHRDLFILYAGKSNSRKEKDAITSFAGRPRHRVIPQTGDFSFFRLGLPRAGLKETPGQVGLVLAGQVRTLQLLGGGEAPIL